MAKSMSWDPLTSIHSDWRMGPGPPLSISNEELAVMSKSSVHAAPSPFV